MHYFQGPHGTHFNYNGGFDGEVIIRKEFKDGRQPTIEIPMDDILALVAEYIRQHRISALEQQDVFGLVFGLQPTVLLTRTCPTKTP